METKAAKMTGRETFLVGKVRKHRFEGEDFRHCSRCSLQFAAVIHK